MHVLTKREYHQWLAYFKYKQPDETEIQLALIAAIISQGLGNKKAKMTDFIINKKDADKPSSTIMSENEVRAVFAGLATKTL